MNKFFNQELKQPLDRQSLTFATMALDRASGLRKNKDWLSQQLMFEQAIFIPIWRDHFLFTSENLSLEGLSEPNALNMRQNLSHKSQLIELRQQSKLTQQLIECSRDLLFLGLDEGKPIFILEMSSMEKQPLLDLFVDLIAKIPEELNTHSLQLVEFRSSLALLTVKQTSILAYGKSLSYWHKQSQFCGICGHKSDAIEGGHARKCRHEVCGSLHFPRTDPVVIMLVERKLPDGSKQCLLAQHHNIKKQVFSSLAGFVDPGESLEEAVKREVFEEAGINVNNISYQISQPWPFPGSLMIGFYANAVSTELNIDYDELVGAQWFSAEQVRKFDNWGDAGDNHQLPRKESIARYLIDQWLVNQE